MSFPSLSKVNWGPVKRAIGTIAPWIAGTLGTPFAGVAVHALCSAFGLTSDDPKPADVMAAINKASPAQLQALKQAEDQHREAMTKLGFEHIEALAQTTEDDRASARARQIALRDSTPQRLGYLLIGGFLTACFALVWILVSHSAWVSAMPKQGWLLIGSVITLLGRESSAVCEYFYGGNAGVAAGKVYVPDGAPGERGA